MIDETDSPKAERPTDPQELARRVMVEAAHFAGRALEKYLEAHPAHGEAFAALIAHFEVRVSGILSEKPRVALINVHDGITREVFHVDLRAPGPIARTLN